MATATSTRSSKSQDVILSKKLSFTLRHGAKKEHIDIDEGGFVKISDLLCHKKFNGYTEGDILRIVETNDKQRFSVRTNSSGQREIRANQGHTLKDVNVELTPILAASEAPVVVHGTYLKVKDKIEQEGLRKMGRNHIHFATGIPSDKNVISGMRKSCEVYIYIDMEKALRDGYTFFRSANNVILSPGNEEGILPPAYFKEVKIVK